MSRLAGVILAIGVFAPVALAQTGRVEVSSSLDRTAVFVGDHVRYTLEFTAPGDLDVLAEDIARERLPVKGAEVLAQETVERTTSSGRVREVHFTLVTHAVDTTEIVIEPFTVRYYSRRTVGGTQVAPAGQVVVPRSAIPIRSTLPDSGRLPELREPRTLPALPRYVGLTRPLGMGLVALGLIPAILIVLDIAGHLRRARAAVPRRQARRAQGELLDELSGRHLASPAERAEAFERLDHLVRDHLETAAGIPARGLTPAEIGEALRSRPRGRETAADVEALLVTCELARYGPLPPAEDAIWRDALASAERVLRTRTL